MDITTPTSAPLADAFLAALFPPLPPDEVVQWMQIAKGKEPYLREHPETGRGKSSKKPNSGLFLNYAKYIEAGAKRSGYRGFSNSAANRMVTRVGYFGAEVLSRLVADPRRVKTKRIGLGDFLDRLMDMHVSASGCWAYLDMWLDGAPARLVKASLAPRPKPTTGDVALQHGNSKLEVPRRVPAGTVDIIVNDPPYGIGYVGRAGHKAIEDDESPDVCSAWSVPLMWNALKEGGTVYLFSCWQVEPVWRAALEKAGFVVAEVLIWDKVHPSGSGAPAITTLSQHELIIVAHKGRAEREVWTDVYGLTSKPGKPIARDVSIWSHEVPKDHHTREGHPTQKPVEVMMRALLNHSRPGDLVLDMFAGSGPVAVAAKRLGRRYIGFEKDASYFAIGRENLDLAA